MEDELTDSESIVSIDDAKTNKDNFKKMLKLCFSSKEIPNQYIHDMLKMYNSCDHNKISNKLCVLILKGIKHISVENKNSFQFAADIYNELLQLTKKDSTNSQNGESNASTSNGSEIENKHDDIIEDKKSGPIFKKLIQKCYENPNFPKSNIEVIDKLYDSISAELTDSELFLSLLKEADRAIWPDSRMSSYYHIEHIYEQLKQFHTSMMVQDRKISVESKEINEKKFKKLNQLNAALKIARSKIKALDEAEMDVNDDEIFGTYSPYLLKDKYEKRAVEIYKKMCKLRDEPDFLEKPPLHFKQTNNRLVNKCIEKYYNMNQVFPDYYEVYTLLKMLNEKKKLNWTESELKNISHDAFLQLGKQLKTRRLHEYFGRLSYITIEKDPAEGNEELRKKLEESKKKLKADLDKVSEKFINKQRYAEETEGSNLSNSECEKSSEDECNKSDDEYLVNKPISIKRKRVDESENEDYPIKRNDTESFNTCPCSVILEKLDDDEILNKISVPKKVDLTNTKNAVINEKNIHNESPTTMLQNANTSEKEDLKNNLDEGGSVSSTEGERTLNKISVVPKKVDLTNTNVVINEKNIHNDSPTTMLQNVNTSEKENLKNNLVVEGSISSTEGDGTLVIDEDNDFRSDDPQVSTQENEFVDVGNKNSSMDNSVISVDSDSYSSLFPEPEVIINEEKDNVIEITDHEESDVEITSSNAPIVPVKNKMSLENIIKSMNFEKKYNWGQNQISKQQLISSNTIPIHVKGRHQLSNPIQNTNTNFVNRWIVNNAMNYNNTTKPEISNIQQSNKRQNNYLNHGMQSMVQKSMTQTHSRFSNSIGQPRHSQPNCQPVHHLLQRQITTMTTTTTVRRVVQQRSSDTIQQRPPVIPRNTRIASQSNSNDNPELIELD